MRLSAILALLAMLAASPDIRYFQYERHLQGIEQRTGQSCLVLDPAIFPHAAAGLADLRIYRDGAEIPFVLHTAAASEGGLQTIAPLNLGRRGGETVFDVSLPTGRYSDLQLDVTGQNFIAAVTVTGSQTDAGSAETRIGSYTIFDLTSQKLGRSTILHLPESDFRFLHFRIHGQLAPESIKGVSVEQLPASQPSYQTIAETSHIERKGHTSVLQFTLPAHLPVDRIAFTPGASPVQFNRALSVSSTFIPASRSTGTDQPVQTHFSGNLLRVHSMENGQRIDEEHLAIDVSWADSSQPSQWTITIENGDDAPLTMESVRLQMLERSLCFETAASGNYALYYGDPAIIAPRYDYATFFTPQANAVRIAAGPERQNPAYQPRPDDRPFTEKHPALLWIALVALIALLGTVALRSAKRVEPTPP
jgi:hypothetical protein